MMTAPDRRITLRLRASIAEMARLRDEALTDLASMPEHKIGSDWHQDRLSDLAFAGRWLQHQAEQFGIEPAELLSLAGLGPRAS